MDTASAQTRRKIDPGRGDRLADGTPNDKDRVEIGPTPLAFGNRAAAWLARPDLPRMREVRGRRLTAAMQARDVGGLLMFDPLDIRHATDRTNMQLRTPHNPVRAVLRCTGGHMVLFDCRRAQFLSAFNAPSACAR